jgi:hypothetical protein
MNRERVLRESKDYLIDIHDTLQRSFRSVPGEEQVFIAGVLENIKSGVKQLEMLQEMIKIWKITKDKKEIITEE